MQGTTKNTKGSVKWKRELPRPPPEEKQIKGKEWTRKGIPERMWKG